MQKGEKNNHEFIVTCVAFNIIKLNIFAWHVRRPYTLVHIINSKRTRHQRDVDTGHPLSVTCRLFIVVLCVRRSTCAEQQAFVLWFLHVHTHTHVVYLRENLRMMLIFYSTPVY